MKTILLILMISMMAGVATAEDVPNSDVIKFWGARIIKFEKNNFKIDFNKDQRAALISCVNKRSKPYLAQFLPTRNIAYIQSYGNDTDIHPLIVMNADKWILECISKVKK